MADQSKRGDVLVEARELSYVKPGYRSFEFATFEARAGEVLALLSSGRAAARDALLAIAGAVCPTAGSLMVRGTVLADAPAVAPADAGLRRRIAAVLRAARRPVLPRGAVGLGAASGVAVPEGTLTVEEVVGRELVDGNVPHGGSAAMGDGSGGPGSRADGILAYLARFQLATRTDQRVAALPAIDRARLSAALAFACKPRVACIDLADAFCGGMAADEAARVVRELSMLAAEDGIAVVVGTTEPLAALAADAAAALDLDAEEALASSRAAAIQAPVRSGTSGKHPSEPDSAIDDEGADA